MTLPLTEQDDPAVEPRLLNLKQAAVFLGCSYWSVRDWVLAGVIPTVSLPPLRAREGDKPKLTLRRVLIDRVDLEAFIEARKGVERVREARTVHFAHSGPAVANPQIDINAANATGEVGPLTNGW